MENKINPLISFYSSIGVIRHLSRREIDKVHEYWESNKNSLTIELAKDHSRIANIAHYVFTDLLISSPLRLINYSSTRETSIKRDEIFGLAMKQNYPEGLRHYSPHPDLVVCLQEVQ